MKFDWIPQMFMDVIGRVLPGVLTLMACAFVCRGPSDAIDIFTKDGSSMITWPSLLIWFLVSYLIGFSLTQLWYQSLSGISKLREKAMRSECAAKMLADHNKMQRLLGQPELNFQASDLPRMFVLHDRLRFAAPAEAARLLKLHAERRVCHVLILSFGGLAIVNAGYILRDPSLERLVLEAMLVLVVTSCWKRQFRLVKYFTNGTCLAWLTLASLGKLSQAEDA